MLVFSMDAGADSDEGALDCRMSGESALHVETALTDRETSDSQRAVSTVGDVVAGVPWSGSESCSGRLPTNRAMGGGLPSGDRAASDVVDSAHSTSRPTDMGQHNDDGGVMTMADGGDPDQQPGTATRTASKRRAGALRNATLLAVDPSAGART